METLRQDIGFALRTLRNSPGFAFIAVLSLALGIGANSAIFSIYSALFNRQLGVRDIGSLVDIYTSDEFDEYLTSSYLDYLDIREQSSEVFSDVITYNLTLSIQDLGEESRYVFGEEVTGNYFQVLGVEPALGRFFDERTDDVFGAEPTTVLMYGTWQSWYGGDTGVLGRRIKLNGSDFTIIGVAPPGFTGMFPFNVDMWTPIHMREVNSPDAGLAQGASSLERRGSRSLWMKARLRPGVTLEQAQATLSTIAARLAEDYPDSNENRRINALRSADVALVPFLDRPVKLFLVFLMCMVGLVLLIACTNLAGMLLARASRRRQEIGVRLALGASRWRLIRQLLTESLVLALLGGLAGLLLAEGLVRLLLALRPPIPIPLNVELGVNGQVVLFAFLLSVATGIFFGLAPALQSTRADMMTTLRDAWGTLRGRLRRFGLRSSLVVAQVAVSAVLLLCAGLFVRSLGSANRVDRGFTIRQGAIATLDIGYKGYDEVTGAQWFDRLRERLESNPGVVAVGYASDIPLDASMSTTTFYPLDTEVPYDEEEGIEVDISETDAGYFEAMGVDILLGRTFGPEDVPDGERVAIINQTLANRFWPDQSPIGKRIARGRDRTPYTIIGVARDGKYRSLGDRARPYLYMALSQSYEGFRSVVVRSRMPSEEAAHLLRSEIRALDPDVPLFDLVTVPEHSELMLFLPRLVAVLVGGLGLLSLLLGTTGLYGIIAYDTSRRTREVGIRMALGADRRGILQMMVWDGMKLVVVGMLIGIAITVPLTGLLHSLLYGVSPLDPATFVGIPVLFLLITVAATLNPARRASRVDPMGALRSE